MMFRIDPLLITILINQNQVLGRKNKNIHRPPEINKRELPKSCSYCNKRDTIFPNILKRKNESKPHGSIARIDFKDPLMSIVAEKANLRLSNSQFYIVENYKAFDR